MSDKDFYAQILGITNPWQVSSVDLNVSKAKVAVEVAQKEGTGSCCPSCCKES